MNTHTHTHLSDYSHSVLLVLSDRTCMEMSGTLNVCEKPLHRGWRNRREDQIHQLLELEPNTEGKHRDSGGSTCPRVAQTARPPRAAAASGRVGLGRGLSTHLKILDRSLRPGLKPFESFRPRTCRRIATARTIQSNPTRSASRLGSESARPPG